MNLKKWRHVKWALFSFLREFLECMADLGLRPDGGRDQGAWRGRGRDCLCLKSRDFFAPNERIQADKDELMKKEKALTVRIDKMDRS